MGQKRPSPCPMVPVSRELWDGTYTLDGLLDIVELIRMRRENENRAAEAARE